MEIEAGEILVLTDWSIDDSRGRREEPASGSVDILHILTMVCLTNVVVVG
jgi:hypothetical protein